MMAARVEGDKSMRFAAASDSVDRVVEDEERLMTVKGRDNEVR